ncbi:S-adenosyl-l-methionine hydroxide adenosyltransferase family protein [Chloroflexota bacterium]
MAITRPRFWRSPVSPTFHGRDIFAPVTAQLSLGLPPTDFGEAITTLTVLPLPNPHREPGGLLVGHVLHIDGFGNLITNIKSDYLAPTKQAVTIEVSNRLISRLSNTYAEGEELLALIGSSRYLEVSLKGGNASAFLNASVGDEVKIRQH